MFTNLARAAALGAVLLVALPAAGTGTGTAKSVRVSYADLNLISEAGKAVFERRIARAADRACGSRVDPRDLAASRVRNRCVAAALDSARPAVELAYRDAATRQLAARDQSIRVAP